MVDWNKITIFVKLSKRMSKIKELKNKEQNNINLIDLYKRILGTDKTKYVELLEILIVKKLYQNYPADSVLERIKRYAIDFNTEGMTIHGTMLLQSIIDNSGDENIQNFIKFVNYNERGLIDNNDVTTYKDFDQICKEVNKADLKDLSKSLSKQVVTLLNDDEWIIVKPLTYESSKKYGANTRWCTTAANDPQYFYKYFRNGILTYCLNKKTGYKIAVYKALNEKSVTFWNQEDSAIDSFSSELPTEIISLLRKEYNDCKKSNFSLSDQEFVEKEMALNGVVYRDRTARGNVRVGNQFDGEQPEDEGPGEDAGLDEMAAEIDREIIRDIRMLRDGPQDIDDGLEEMVLAPHPGAVERVYGGGQVAIDAEAELTEILERELGQYIVGQIDVETVVRPLRVRMDRIIDETFIREINTDDQEIPEVNLEMETREIGSNRVDGLREVDFDEIPGGAMSAFLGDEVRATFEAPPLHHGNEYRDGMPVGRMVTEDVLNERRNEVRAEGYIVAMERLNERIR